MEPGLVVALLLPHSLWDGTPEGCVIPPGSGRGAHAASCTVQARREHVLPRRAPHTTRGKG